MSILKITVEEDNSPLWIGEYFGKEKVEVVRAFLIDLAKNGPVVDVSIDCRMAMSAERKKEV